MPDYIPSGLGPFDEFAQNFVEIITNDPTSFGLTTDQSNFPRLTRNTPPNGASIIRSKANLMAPQPTKARRAMI